MQHKNGGILPGIARHAISDALHETCQETDFHRSEPWLKELGASFVTLKQDGVLRGCIGTLQAYQSLLADVRKNAVNAALHDPRFLPLARDELATVRIEVSLLSAPQLFNFIDEQDALAQLQPGIDGVVLEYGRMRSTFLPQVWETLPQPQQFITALKTKAGLDKGFWHEDIKLSRYTVNKWCEAG